jgi:hypothetical protein
MVIHRFNSGPSTSSRSRPRLLVARRFRLVALVLLVVWPISSCHYWSDLPAPEKGFGQDEDHVRVRTPDGRELVVWYPRLTGDSLFGAASRSRSDSVDIRLGNLSEIELRRTDATTPTLMIVLIGGVIAAAAVVSVQNMRIP